MKTGGRSKASGFTLLENVFALAIFTFSIVALVEALSLNMLLVDESSEIRLVREMLNARIHELSLRDDLPMVPRESPSDLPEFLFREKATSLALKNREGKSLDGLVELTVSVYRKDRVDSGPVITSTVWINTGRIP